MQTIVFPIIRFLHDLFTAVWIGGLVLMALVILPALKKSPQVKEPRAAMLAIQSRLKTFAIISMVGLALTGMLLSNREPEFSALFSFGTKYNAVLSVKHLLMILMVALSMLRLWLNKKQDKNHQPKVEKYSAAVLFLNAFVGLVVLFLSAFISVTL